MNATTIGAIVLIIIGIISLFLPMIQKHLANRQDRPDRPDRPDNRYTRVTQLISIYKELEELGHTVSANKIKKALPSVIEEDLLA